uniref:AB hydrolase-1 domain-containing protein n=1 Tax=Oryza meridionalis TaxID=40149 RepID=A0A0E0D599_9ORYZ
MVPRILIVLLVVLLGLAFQAILRPPPQKLCGAPGGPPVTSPRIKLRDGRYLAYREDGVQKDKAKFKIISVHAFDSTKDFPLQVSKELVDELGIYIVGFDRAGYGESDPNPKRDVKSEALDIEELADQLELGHKFYVLGVSMGGYSIWGCLQYIQNRQFSIRHLKNCVAHQELVDELGIYLLAFDRAGYGENDPNPKRNARSEALDIEELTDQPKLGRKFCVGNVDGRIPNLRCLQYIPNRSSVSSLPIINYWWPSSPAELSRQAFMGLIVPEQRTLWIAHNINFLALPLDDPEVAPFFCGSHASS